ncbi:MAG: DUF4097 family beta strand repeat protein [Opitutae bacterium]|nr:DUF4097 family beta strand repeat protein [Opitutae bacterium]
MKIHLRSLLRLGAACAALAFAATALHADEDAAEQNTVRSKFSDPSKPGTLKVSLPWAEVHVTGTDGNDIVVTSTLEQKGKKDVAKDGFRRLDEDVSFEVIEKGNVATIVMSGDNLWAAHGAEFHVQVPRNTSLILRTEAGGDVNVENIDGDIDINSMNGEVSLTDIGSSAVVNTMNGEVTANFRKVPAKPVSITSMNGEIDLRLPADTKANLRMRTHNGTIRTNFPEGVLQAKTEKVSGSRGFTTGYGPNRDQIREITRQAERMARDAERMAREHVKLARVHADAARDDKDDEDNDGETPTPPADPAVAAAPDAASTPAPAAKPVATTLPAPAPMPPVPGWSGGKSIVGTLNGGGIDIQLSSMNGTITLRQTK